MKTRSPLEKQIGRFRRNLLKVYRTATPSALANGRAWYPEAQAIVRELADTYGYTHATVACVVAALSPQCSWERNLLIADDVLAGRAVSVGGALHSNIRKARALLDARGELDTLARLYPQGYKVNAFAANLLGLDDVVTVDSHGTQAAFNNPTLNLGLKRAAYSVVARTFSRAARSVGESPSTFQAIVWCAWKERYPRAEKNRIYRRRKHS